MKVTYESVGGDRYCFDFGVCSSQNGFAQVDTAQDASYYGMWANPFSLEIVSFCEGDFTHQLAESQQEFTNELEKIVKWANKNSRFKGIDVLENGGVREQFVKLGLSKLLH